MRFYEIKKYAAAAALSAAVVLAAAGCSKQGKPTEPSQTTESASAVETDEPAESAQASESAQEAAPGRTMPKLESEEEIGMMTGVVKDAAMNTVVVSNSQYPDGITFSKEDAAVSLADGLKLDGEITVIFRGTLKEGASLTAELVRDKRDGDEDRRAGVVSGEVLGIGMSAVTIRTKDGKELSFEQDPKPVNVTDGPMEGEKIQIFYSFKEGEQWYAPEMIAE